MAAALGLLLAGHTTADELPGEWLEWRGPLRTGAAPDADPPVRWDEETNVRWKTRLPGFGHSSPIVTAEYVFVTAAEPFGPKLEPVPPEAPGAHDNLEVTQRQRFFAVCVNRSDGSVCWKKVLAEVLPHEGGHQTGSPASASPISDGERLFVSLGSHGVFALDFEGNVLWQRSTGKLITKHAHGEGSSPALADGVLIVNSDHEGQSFIDALSTEDGRTLWHHERNEVTSWSSPLIVRSEQRLQVVTAGTDRIRAYDLHSGEELWECGGLSANVVATPTASDGILIAASSYDTRAMLAIDLKAAHGDITGTQRVLWQTNLRTPYVPSMLISNGAVWFLRHYQNVFSRRGLRDGSEPAGPFRLPGIRDVYASPVAAQNRIYVTDLYGVTVVMSDGKNPELLALNRLDDEFAATPAIAGRQLFLRGRRYLYCIEEPRSAARSESDR